MIVLKGGDIVLPDRIIHGSLVINDDQIVAIEPRASIDPGNAVCIEVSGHTIVPGFVDVHVHGVEGVDTLDGTGAIAAIAASLPKYGVTAFCPTTVACAPLDLQRMLNDVRAARLARPDRSARVLPAHLESNFINPAYRGAQPLACLRIWPTSHNEGEFSGRDVMETITAFRPDVGIVTLAPELPGGVDLVRHLVAAGHRVSLGHSAASYEEAVAAIEAGAHQATHLFNRMSPLGHRSPGLVGAVLDRDEVAAELICDGHHVHPALCRTAIAAKGPGGVMAITDATAGAGLSVGSTARLGGQIIAVAEHAALLEDGTLAGSTVTMDRTFRNIVSLLGLSLVDAAALCSTTAASRLGLHGFGTLAAGATADLVVLDDMLRVVRTFIGGREVYNATEPAGRRLHT
jgi:N-acetylglucosamine-6-phosphate deacetylase